MFIAMIKLSNGAQNVHVRKKPVIMYFNVQRCPDNPLKTKCYKESSPDARGIEPTRIYNGYS